MSQPNGLQGQETKKLRLLRTPLRMRWCTIFLSQTKNYLLYLRDKASVVFSKENFLAQESWVYCFGKAQGCSNCYVTTTSQTSINQGWVQCYLCIWKQKEIRRRAKGYSQYNAEQNLKG